MTNAGILFWGQQSILLWIIIAMIMVHRSIHASEAGSEIRTDAALVWNDAHSEEWAEEVLASSTIN